MRTTLVKLCNCGICKESLQKLLTYLGKTKPDDEPLLFRTILDSNGARDTAWCMRHTDGYERIGRLYTVWRLKQNKKIMSVEAVKNHVAVMERGYNGKASNDEMRLASNEFSIWILSTENIRKNFARDETDEYIEASEKEEMVRILDCLGKGVDPYPFI